VRGVTPALLFGEDTNHNGILDPNENDGATTLPLDNADNILQRGWSAFLTVYSREINRDSDTQPRIYLNDKDLQGLYDKLNTAVGDEMATWILAYRLYGAVSSGGGSSGSMVAGGTLSFNQLDLTKRASSISSIYSLVDAVVGIPQSGGGGGNQMVVVSTVTISNGTTTTTSTTKTTGTTGGTTSGSTGSSSGGKTTGSTGSGGSSGTSGSGTGGGGGGGGGGSGQTTTKTYPSPLSDPSKLNQLLPLLLDKCTTRKDAEIPARVNVNTASRAVLTCLPGLEDSDVQTILSNRPTPGSYDVSDMTYQTSAWLLTQAKLPTSKLKALERYVTARTQTYRVQALGYFDQGGPVGMLADQLRDPIGERSAAVLFEIPGRTHDVGQEALHLGLVVEELAIEMAGIPVDEDAAKVEHDRGRTVGWVDRHGRSVADLGRVDRRSPGLPPARGREPSPWT
jgi:hypothetical protein